MKQFPFEQVSETAQKERKRKSIHGRFQVIREIARTKVEMIHRHVLSLVLLLGVASAELVCHGGCGEYTCSSGVGYYCCGYCDCCMDVWSAWWFWLTLVSKYTSRNVLYSSSCVLYTGVFHFNVRYLWRLFLSPPSLQIPICNRRDSASIDDCDYDIQLRYNAVSL